MEKFLIILFFGYEFPLKEKGRKNTKVNNLIDLDKIMQQSNK